MGTSIVVCTYGLDRVDLVKVAVSSLFTQTFWDHEVVVVADVAPHIYDVLTSGLPPQVRVVINDRPGNQACARNAGIEAAAGEVVGFLDDDAVAESHWLERLMGQLHNEHVVGVGGKAVPMWEEGERPTWLPEELDWVVGGTYRGYPESAQPVRNIHGHNMIFRKEVLRLVGGFRLGRTGGDPVTCDGDEVELCLRIRQSRPSSLFMFEPRAVIWHRVSRGKAQLRYLLRKSYGQGKGKAMIHAMHKSNPAVLSSEVEYVHYLIFHFFPRMARRIFSGDVKMPLTRIMAVLGSSLSTLCGYSISRLELALRRKAAGSDSTLSRGGRA